MRSLILVGVVCAMVACSSDDTSSTGKTNPSDAGNGDAGSDASSGGTGGSAGTATGGSAGTATGGSAGTAAGGSAGTAAGGSAGSLADAGADAGTKWDTYCQQQSVHWTSCNKAGFECLPASCIYSVYDPTVLDEYTSCLLDRACNDLGSDDDCFSAAGTLNGQLPAANQAKVDALKAKYTSCGGSAGPVKLDWAGYFSPIVLVTYFDQASLCLEKSCADIAACFATLGTAFDCLDG